jgi:Ca2+-dependent lipid-binding protein
MLMDPSQYAFDVPVSSRGRRKRARSSSSEQSEERSERKRKERNARQSERRKQTRKGKEGNSAETSSARAPVVDKPRLRSPTPPPEHTRVPLPGGGFRYSEHERDYVTRYVTILLQRDHQISHNAMAQALFKKVYICLVTYHGNQLTVSCLYR